MSRLDLVRARVRDVPDFPKPGILFKDITPIFQDPGAWGTLQDLLRERFAGQGIDVVAGIESRGFLFGAPLALHLGVPFAVVRKAGKLPWKTVSQSYDLEYGSATIELHEDAVHPGQRVLIVDDLLATGGTAQAAAQLVERMGGVVAACAFIIELGFLKGRTLLEPREVVSLIHY